MSDSQVGARVNQNIRNHTLIFNDLIKEVLNKKNNNQIDIQNVEVRQCVDGLSPEV